MMARGFLPTDQLTELHSQIANFTCPYAVVPQDSEHGIAQNTLVVKEGEIHCSAVKYILDSPFGPIYYIDCVSAEAMRNGRDREHRLGWFDWGVCPVKRLYDVIRRL